MKPKQALRQLEFIVHDQKSVSTSRLKRLVKVIGNHQKMLERDNKRLRKRIKRQRKALNRLEVTKNEMRRLQHTNSG